VIAPFGVLFSKIQGGPKMKSHTFITILIVFLLTSILPNGSSLGIQLNSVEAVDSPPLMSDFINIWTDAVDNVQPTVVYNPRHDEYLVVWVTEVDDYTWDIWGQRVRSDGSLPPDGWFNIDSAAGLKLTSPSIAYNPTLDQYLVVYSCQQSTDDYNIWGRVIDWYGGQHSRLYLETAPLNQAAPDIAYNKQASTYLLAYENVQPGGEYFIELRSLSMDGNIIDGRTIASPAGEYRIAPAVVYNPERNNFFLVYSLEYTSGPPQIIGRTVSADLSQIGPEFEYTDSINYGMYPSVALGRNEYLITWWYPEGPLTARRADLEGFPLGPSGGFPIATAQSLIMNSYPQVARAGLSGYLVAWNYFEMDTTDVGNIYGRYVGYGEDQPLDDRFAIDARTNYQGSTALACTPAGSCLVVNVHNPAAYPLGDYEISGRLIFMTQVYLPLAMR
jgi:hypothetical protein